ncbi:MAG: hypothetical protein LBP31_00410 [Holosporales bacterium]|jgi:hypothetical protein|nr:hypothetical protein [Holosporales bacterium]
MKSLYIVAASFLCIAAGAVASEEFESLSFGGLFRGCLQYPNLPTDFKTKLENLSAKNEEKVRVVKENISEIKKSVNANQVQIRVSDNTLLELDEFSLGLDSSMEALKMEVKWTQNMIVKKDEAQKQPFEFESEYNLEERSLLLGNVIKMRDSHKEIRKIEQLVKAREMSVNRVIANKDNFEDYLSAMQLYQEIDKAYPKLDEMKKEIGNIAALFKEFLNKK